MKKIFALILAAVMLVSLAACSETGSSDPTEAPAVTAAPTDAPTEAPTEAATEAEPTAEPTPKVQLEVPTVEGLDAIITEFITNDEITAILDDSGNETEIKNGEPFVTVYKDEGNSHFCVYIIDDGEESCFTPQDYPYLAMLYRISYGASHTPGNMLFPYAESGLTYDYSKKMEYVTNDGDWHLIYVDVSDSQETIGDWYAVRIPIPTTQGSSFSLAYIGAFKTEDDVNAYYNAFVEMYADKLTKLEPESTKDEKEVDTDDRFDEDIIDFDECTVNDSISGYDYGGIWSYSQGAAQSDFKELTEDNTVIYLSFDSISTSMVKEGTAYKFECDFKNTNNSANFGGFVVNWGNENNLNRDFFEGNGVYKDGDGSICGRSGCGIDFTESNKGFVYVMTYEDGKKSCIRYDFESTVDFTADFCHFIIEDNGTDTITFKVGDEVLAIVKYSNPGLHQATVVGYDERYYRNATICNAAGEEVVSTECSLISVYKGIAAGGRAHTIYLDNLQITNG